MGRGDDMKGSELDLQLVLDLGLVQACLCLLLAPFQGHPATYVTSLNSCKTESMRPVHPEHEQEQGLRKCR